MTDSKISYHRDRNGIPEIDLFVPFVVIHDREPSCMAGWIVIAPVTVPSRSAHNTFVDDAVEFDVQRTFNICTWSTIFKKTVIKGIDRSPTIAWF
jgi:hypothetical protein